MVDAPEEPRKKSLVKLLADVPGLISQLIRDEIDQLKRELVTKLTAVGVGAGLFAAAAFLGFFVFAILLTAAILGLAVVLPAWLAALIVAVVLLIVAAILVMVGLRKLKKGVPPVPQDALKSVRNDVRAIKGMGKYDH